MKCTLRKKKIGPKIHLTDGDNSFILLCFLKSVSLQVHSLFQSEFSADIVVK